MTEPGTVEPVPPGWWVRTGRVGSVESSYGWTATNAGIHIQSGRASGSYGWTATATGMRALNFYRRLVGGLLYLNGYYGASAPIPDHQPGDILVAWAYRNDSAIVPSKPSAGGTVPAWVDVGSSGGNLNSGRSAYCVATSSSHTSGTWANASFIYTVVLKGQHATPPLGGHAATNGSTAGVMTAPAITLANTDGSSVVLAFLGRKGPTTGSAPSIPSGWNRRIYSVSAAPICEVAFYTKNVTTSDGSCAVTVQDGGSNYAWQAEMIEFKAH